MKELLNFKFVKLSVKEILKIIFFIRRTRKVSYIDAVLRAES